MIREILKFALPVLAYFGLAMFFSDNFRDREGAMFFLQLPFIMLGIMIVMFAIIMTCWWVYRR